MKYFRNHLRILFILLSVILAEGVRAQAKHYSELESMDYVKVSLLTCSPGQEIWSLYGHTALRYEDTANNIDIAINYGLFDYSQKNFYMKFVFGHCDYQVGAAPMPMFLMEYASEGRGVVQQTLNLSREEKLAIKEALAENLQPDNRMYRYNFYYDNCTTRARDMIVSHLDGKTEYAVNEAPSVTWRQMIHGMNHSHRWMSFGCDLLLGVGSDSKADFAQQQFLPDTLRKDFDHAMIVEPTGKKHKLVSSKSTILQINEANVKNSTSLWDTITPTVFFAALFVLTIILAMWEYRRKKVFWLYDVVLLTLTGLAGLVLLAMVFSLHPTVRINFQILLLNPLSIVFVYSVGTSIKKGHYNKYWNVLMACLILFLIGGFFQDYAEGMILLACTLLVRCIINRSLYNNKTTKKVNGK